MLLLGPLNSPHLIDRAQELTGRGIEVHLGGYRSPLLDSERQAGTHWEHEIPARALWRGAGTALRSAWIRRLARRVRAEVIHAHDVTTFGFPAALSGVRPLVSTALGSDVLAATGRNTLANRVAVRHSTYITADSPLLRRRVIALGAPESRTELVGWGVDLGKFHPVPERRALRRELDLPAGPVILSPRAARAPYSPETVVAAFELVADRHPDAHLIVKHLGITCDVSSSRHAERIIVIGNVPRNRLIALYQTADVCVSIPSSDSGPRTVWEAMACGAPCVLSDLPWIEGMVEPGADALVAAVEPSAVARAIEALIDDPTRAQAISRNALARVRREHVRDAHMRRLISVYSRAIQASNPKVRAERD